MIYYRILSLLVVTVFFISCAEQSDKTEIGNHKVITPEETIIRHATGFKIVLENGIKKMHILNPFANYDIENTFILLQTGQSYSAQENETIIKVPVRKIVPMSTTFYSSIEELNQTKSVVAIANSSFVFSQQLLSRCASGSIAQIGNGQQLNVEKLILLNPDVIIVNGYQGGLENSYVQMQNAEIPVVLNYDWKETTPLARAEWIKFFGVLYNQEQLADSIFNQIESNYNDYKSILDTIDYKPNVLFSSSYQGTWYMPGGKSYVAQFLKDAKGTYPWSSDKTTGSLPLSIEVVANKMLDADIWIDSQSFSLVNLKQKDVRYAEFKPYKQGNVYEHDARINKEGGNDFWESGALRVDLLLKDYIKILHPKILADHRLTFFRKLE